MTASALSSTRLRLGTAPCSMLPKAASEQPVSPASWALVSPASVRALRRSRPIGLVVVAGMDAFFRPQDAGHGGLESVQAPLLVSTALVGDTIREVAPGHATYARLAWALGEQDGWDHRAHAAFWTALLPELPARGRLTRVELVSRAASALRADGLTRAEVENILSVAPGTVRARAPEAAGRDRPSYARGDRLRREAQSGSYGEALARTTGRTWVPWDARPRVWDDARGEPDHGHFNLLIEAEWQPPGLDSALAAEEELRRRWYRRRGRDDGPAAA